MQCIELNTKYAKSMFTAALGEGCKINLDYNVRFSLYPFRNLRMNRYLVFSLRARLWGDI